MRLPHMDKRIIIVDTSQDPAIMLTNCLTCNRLTNKLESEGLMCLDCYRKWSIKFAKDYVLPF